MVLQAYPPNVNVYPQPFIGQDPPSFDYAPASAYFAPGPTTVSRFLLVTPSYQ